MSQNCHCHDNADLGLHPGSGSQRPIVRGNRLERNNIGLFFCWGVKYGLAEKNVIEESKSYGISIGHRDTDNLIRDNDVRRSGRERRCRRIDAGHAMPGRRECQREAPGAAPEIEDARSGRLIHQRQKIVVVSPPRTLGVIDFDEARVVVLGVAHLRMLLVRQWKR